MLRLNDQNKAILCLSPRSTTTCATLDIVLNLSEFIVSTPVKWTLASWVCYETLKGDLEKAQNRCMRWLPITAYSKHTHYLSFNGSGAQRRLNIQARLRVSQSWDWGQARVWPHLTEAVLRKDCGGQD